MIVFAVVCAPDCILAPFAVPLETVYGYVAVVGVTPKKETVPPNLPRLMVLPVKDKGPVPATRFVIIVDVKVNVFVIVLLILIGTNVAISVCTKEVVEPNVLLSVESCVTVVGVVEKVTLEAIVFTFTDIF